MKILVLSYYYKPDLSAGSFRISSLIDSFKRLSNKDIYVDIITTTPNRYAPFIIKVSNYEIDRNITIVRATIKKNKNNLFREVYGFLKYMIFVFKYIENKEYDIVFATTSRLMTGFLGAIISKIRNIPLFLDIRDIFLDSIKSINSQIIKCVIVPLGCPLIKIIEKFTLSSSNRISVVSEGFIDYFRLYHKKDKILFFPNGIDEIFINVKFNENIKILPKKEKTNITLVYAGNIGYGQGLEKIVPKIANEFRNISFIIIGDGSQRDELSKRVSKLSNVTIVNPIKRHELLYYYEKADVLFLHLSDFDGFKKNLPSKIFEYAATFKPIVAGVDGYARSFLERYLPDVLIFKPCNYEEFKLKFKKFTFEVDIEKRRNFINKFRRDNIMSAMVSEIIKLK